MEMLDPRPLRTMIAAIADDLRALKRWHRTPPAKRPEPPVTHFGLGLFAAKRRATIFHMALAQARGRQHLRVWHGRAVASLEDQQALLDEELGRLPEGILGR